MDAKEILAGAMDAVAGVLAEEGDVPAIVLIVDAKGRYIDMPYKRTENIGRERGTIIAAIRLMRMVGQFQGVALISSAWMSRHKKENAALAQVMAPSEDPDRIEIVMMVAQVEAGKAEMVAWEIDRSGDKTRLGKQLDTKFDQVETWLDRAFTAIGGYYGA